MPGTPLAKQLENGEPDGRDGAMNDLAATPNYAIRLAEYYRRHGVHCETLGGTLWIEDKRMIFPVGPVSRDYTIARNDARSLLSHSRSALLVSSTSGLEMPRVKTSWYAVICRRWKEPGELSANTRSKLSRGLRNNEVRKVDARFIAEHGHETHAAACARYGLDPKAEDRFKKSILVAGDFADVIDFWAVFHQDVLVGYAQVHLFERIEAYYTGVAFHPEFFKFYTSYALIHKMNEYYLRQNSFAYANDGFRSIAHPTEFQDFLVDKFGFERAFMRLSLHYKNYVFLVMSLPARIRHLLAKASRKLAALNRLHEARTPS